MRYPTFRILCLSSLLGAAIHCDPDPSPSDATPPDPSMNRSDGGEQPGVDAAPGDAATPTVSSSCAPKTAESSVRWEMSA